MSYPTEVVLEKVSVSDEIYTINEVFFNDGAAVKKGTTILSFETSKASIDLEAPSEGFVFYNCRVGDQKLVGEIVAVISSENALAGDYFKTPAIQKESTSSESDLTNIRISKAAKLLFEQHKLSLEDFGNKSIIDKHDIEEYLAAKANSSKTSTVHVSFNPLKIIIIGGGKHTSVCIDIIRQNKQYDIAGIVYTRYQPVDKILDTDILGGPESLKDIFASGVRHAILGIGGLEDISYRWDTYQYLLSLGFSIPPLVHASAVIEPSAKISSGTQILAGACIGSESVIGENCIINTKAIVSHHCSIGKNSHLAPGAILGGSVTVGENTLIGMGATVFYGARIGSNVIINNSKSIFSNIKDKTRVG